MNISLRVIEVQDLGKIHCELKKKEKLMRKEAQLKRRHV